MFAREEPPHPSAKSPHPGAETRTDTMSCDISNMPNKSSNQAFENVGDRILILYYIY